MSNRLSNDDHMNGLFAGDTRPVPGSPEWNRQMMEDVEKQRAEHQQRDPEEYAERVVAEKAYVDDKQADADTATILNLLIYLCAGVMIIGVGIALGPIILCFAIGFAIAWTIRKAIFWYFRNVGKE